MTTTPTHRDLAFQVAHNVRHLGGYRTRDGRETRPQVIRAASLHRLTDAGVESFVAHGITTVVDLRSEPEREKMPTPSMEARGVRHVFAPVFKGDASPGAFAKDFQGFERIYQRFLETGREAYRVLFQVIAATDGGLVFHCAAGKDRTGVAAALLLDLAGCADADITEDYARSEGLLKDAFQNAGPSPAQEPQTQTMDEATRARLLASEPACMAETLGHVRGRWGSARGYMSDIGLSADEIARLRMRMTW